MFLVDASQGEDHAQALAVLAAQPRGLIISVWCLIIGSCKRPQVSGDYVGTPRQGCARIHEVFEFKYRNVQATLKLLRFMCKCLWRLRTGSCERAHNASAQVVLREVSPTFWSSNGDIDSLQTL
jgi:hypothetical protein